MFLPSPLHYFLGVGIKLILHMSSRNVCLSFCPSFCLNVCPSVRPSVPAFVHPSVTPFDCRPKFVHCNNHFVLMWLNKTHVSFITVLVQRSEKSKLDIKEISRLLRNSSISFYCNILY